MQSYNANSYQLKLIRCFLLSILVPLAATSFLIKNQHSIKTADSRIFASISDNLSVQPIAQPWYSDVNIERDRSHVLDQPKETLALASSRFALFNKDRGVCHQIINPEDPRSSTGPVYVTYEQLQKLFDMPYIEKMVCGASEDLIVWSGKFEENNYFACYTSEDFSNDSELATILGGSSKCISYANLRDFGGRMTNRTDAAILASCNGLVEFHKSHKFCSRCGSKTVSAKVGACRRCTQCKASTYPRIDIATIMLITSPCENYALLGRKKSWPKGRYSTLAGFCEVGETLEECCVREVCEESGIEVDPLSIQFVCSQPWPFPRSLMAGFRGIAIGNTKDLPKVNVDENELEDVQWFSKDFVKENLKGGSSSLSFDPNEEEQEFHIPGKCSLARLLITQWVAE